MKKVFLTIALAAFAFAANAQLVIGANLGVNGSSNSSVNTNTFGGVTTTTETTGPKTLDFYFMPKIGFQFNEKMSAGVILGFSHSNTTTNRVTPWDPSLWGATNYVGTMTTSYNTINVTPYFRYNAAELNNFTLFIEASVPIELKTADKTVLNEEGDVLGTHVTVNREGTDNKYTSIGFNVTPGLNYALNDHLSMDLYFNAISLGFNVTKTHTSVDNFENDETVDTDINWGLNIRTLPAVVSFGINYAF